MSLDLSAPEDAQGFFHDIGATPQQMDDFRAYRGMLAEANSRMNLVGPSALEAFWVRHALDSAQLFHVERKALRWADVGSGAGFPGVPLAILMKPREGAQVHLIESMAKRVDFLRHVCATLDLPVEVHHGRAEDMVAPPHVDIVTARACAPLDRLLTYTIAFFRRGARGLFLKGRGVETEIQTARARWRFDVEQVISRSDPAGRILRIAHVGRRGAA